jgi:hypothetical protein
MLFSNETLETIQQYIKDQLSKDPYAGTPFAGYHFLSVKKKGIVGEQGATAFYDEMGVPISGPTGAGNDLVINGLPSEVKFSLGTKKNTINHFSVGKDWQTAQLIVGNPHKQIGLYVLTKANFIRCLNDTQLFTNQQGGKKVGNDDFMCSDKKLVVLLNSEYVTFVDTWRNPSAV